MRGLDLLLYAGVAGVLVLPWTGAASGIGITVGLAVGIFAIIAVWRGRWQAAPIALAGALAAGVFLAPEPLRPVAAVACALCGALGVFLLWVMPIPKLPRPSGPHAVGLKRFVLEGRKEAPQPLLIYAFYPASPRPGSRTRAYHSRQEDIAASRPAALMRGPTFLFSHFRLARTWVVEDAPEKIAEGGRPLLIFNHGAVSAPTQCTVVMSELASHGYIVLSIGRSGESSGFAWPDGSLTPLARKTLDGLRAMAALPAYKEYIAALQSQDVGATLTALEAAIPELTGSYTAEATLRWRDQSIGVVDRMVDHDVSDAAMPLAKQTDPARIGYLGMSLGGAVAHACCMADRRAKAGANLDGGNWDFAAIGGSIPTAFLNFAGVLERPSKKGEAAPQPAATRLMGNDFYDEPPRTAGSRQDIVRLIIPGASHGDFMDTILAARSGWRRRLGGGEIEAALMLQILNAACVEFFDKFVNGKTNDFPQDVLTRYPEVVRQDLRRVRDWGRAQAGQADNAAS